MPTIKVPGTLNIYSRISTDGRVTSYQVRIRRKGFSTVSRSFDNLDHARQFVRKVFQDHPSEEKIQPLMDIERSVGDVIDQAIIRIDNGRRRTKGAETERLRLVAFRRDFPALCKVALIDATEDMFEDWMAERLEVVNPNTVLRDFALLKPLFATAARKCALSHSPLEYLKPPRMIDERVRRIDRDEEKLLFDELAAGQNPIVAHAARFALETGCRRSECLRIEWPDYDPHRGTIWLSDAKNGRGRYLLLTERAQATVEVLPGRSEGGAIFKVTSNLLKKAFESARARAAVRAESLKRPDLVTVATLRWHDFRHEAISRCFDAGWTSEQVMDFSGHVDIKSLLRYRHPNVDHSVARLRAISSSRDEL
jgi:integrase